MPGTVWVKHPRQEDQNNLDVIMIALAERIACEKAPLEQERQRHPDEAKSDDQRNGLPILHRESGQDDSAQRDREDACIDSAPG